MRNGSPDTGRLNEEKAGSRKSEETNLSGTCNMSQQLLSSRRRVSRKSDSQKWKSIKGISKEKRGCICAEETIRLGPKQIYFSFENNLREIFLICDKFVLNVARSKTDHPCSLLLIFANGDNTLP